MRTSALLSAALLVGGLAQAQIVEDFEGGNPNNWHLDWNGTYNGFAISEVAGTHVATGGNPGGCVQYLNTQAQIDVWFWQAAQGSAEWTGDFRAKGVDYMSGDFRHNAGTSPFGMFMCLVLANDMGTPEVTDDIMAVAPIDWNYTFAGFGAAIVPGVWTNIRYDIPYASTTIPTGWTIQGLGGTYGSGDDDADWNLIIQDVSYVAFTNGSPWGGFVLGFIDFDWDNMQLGPDDLGVSYCYGDGTGAACPCANEGTLPGAGCANGQYASGALLTAAGVPSLSADTLVLMGQYTEHNQFGLFFQADNNLGNGTAWGDGLRCAGGSLKRLGTTTSDGTGYIDTTGYGYTISSKAGNIIAGQTKYYQLWYRNPLNSPCANDFNTSNGLGITWNP